MSGGTFSIPDRDGNAHHRLRIDYSIYNAEKMVIHIEKQYWVLALHDIKINYKNLSRKGNF